MISKKSFMRRDAHNFAYLLALDRNPDCLEADGLMSARLHLLLAVYTDLSVGLSCAAIGFRVLSAIEYGVPMCLMKLRSLSEIERIMFLTDENRVEILSR